MALKVAARYFLKKAYRFVENLTSGRFEVADYESGAKISKFRKWCRKWQYFCFKKKETISIC